LATSILSKYNNLKIGFSHFLQHVTPDSYIPCLADLCKALWEVMLSYYRTMEWHEKHDSEDSASAAGRKLFGFYFKN
jgi:hypothetical protein